MHFDTTILVAMIIQNKIIHVRPQIWRMKFSADATNLLFFHDSKKFNVLAPYLSKLVKKITTNTTLLITFEQKYSKLSA